MESITINLIIAMICAYLYGSIPFSLIIGKVIYKKDIREIGSGNVGGTNLGRVGGPKAFAFGFIMDGSKGVMAVILASLFGVNAVILAICALLGHTFSIFIKFKGGKGVATGFGFVLAYTPVGALIAISFFLIVLLITKYVSVSSVLAILVYDIYSIFDPELTTTYSIIIFFLWVAVVYLHRENIKRVFNGTESKVYLFKKK